MDETDHPEANELPKANVPQSRTQQEIVQEQMQAKTKQAQQAFVDTWKGAQTPAEKMVFIGGVVGLVSFFLPWFSVSELNMSFSGFGLAKEGQTSTWLFPVMMIAALFLSWMHLHSNPKKRILNARWLILIGAAWAWYWIAAVTTNSKAGMATGIGLSTGYGGYLTALASFLVLIGGIMQIQYYTALLPDVE